MGCGFVDEHGNGAGSGQSKSGKIRARHDGPSTSSGCTEPAVARIRPRHDGFTPEKRRRFLKILAKTEWIRDGCRAAGDIEHPVNRWRAKDAEFASACETALEMAASHIELLAWERAVTGIEEPVFSYGKIVKTRVKRSDSIPQLLLIGSSRKKYGRMGAVGRKRC